MRERERERERENLGQWFVATKSGFREREREDSENWKKKNLYFGKKKWFVSFGSIWVWFGSILVTKVGVLVF